MNLKQRASKLVVELLEAQISNVDPEDTLTIIGRWDFLIDQALQEAYEAGYKDRKSEN